MINAENCYVILNEDGDLADDFMDLIFESVEEAETLLEKEGLDLDEYEVLSLADFLE